MDESSYSNEEDLVTPIRSRPGRPADHPSISTRRGQKVYVVQKNKYERLVDGRERVERQMREWKTMDKKRKKSKGEISKGKLAELVLQHCCKIVE